MTGLVEMVIESVRVHMLSNRHVVILKDPEGDRYLPIWIGAWEASAIAMRLQGLAADPDEEVGAEDEDADDEASERPRRRRAPLEQVGNAPADPRLEMFRDFINSLEVDPNAGGESGGRRSS